MCDRFARFSPVQKFAELFGVQADVNLIPRYNATPTQAALAGRNTPGGHREFVTLHWGLIPLGKEPKTGYSTINARAETVATKQWFHPRNTHEADRLPDYLEGTADLPLFL